MSVIEMLKAGDFNSRVDEIQPDGSVRITLSRRGDKRAYHMHVKDLYGENESVLSEAITEGVNDEMVT